MIHGAPTPRRKRPAPSQRDALQSDRTCRKSQSLSIVAEQFVKVLVVAGVKRIYGIVGDRPLATWSRSCALPASVGSSRWSLGLMLCRRQ